MESSNIPPKKRRIPKKKKHSATVVAVAPSSPHGGHSVGTTMTLIGVVLAALGTLATTAAFSFLYFIISLFLDYGDSKEISTVQFNPSPSCTSDHDKTAIRYSAMQWVDGDFSRSDGSWTITSVTLGTYPASIESDEPYGKSYISIANTGPYAVYLEADDEYTELMFPALAESLQSDISLDIDIDTCKFSSGERRATCVISSEELSLSGGCQP